VRNVVKIIFKRIIKRDLRDLIVCATSHGKPCLLWYRGILHCACGMRHPTLNRILRHEVYEYFCYCPMPVWHPIVQVTMEGQTYSMLTPTLVDEDAKKAIDKLIEKGKVEVPQSSDKIYKSGRQVE